MIARKLSDTNVQSVELQSDSKLPTKKNCCAVKHGGSLNIRVKRDSLMAALFFMWLPPYPSYMKKRSMLFCVTNGIIQSLPNMQGVLCYIDG